MQLTVEPILRVMLIAPRLASCYPAALLASHYPIPPCPCLAAAAGEALELLRVALIRCVVIAVGLPDTASARERELRHAVGRSGAFPWLGGAAAAIASPPRRRNEGSVGAGGGGAGARSVGYRGGAPSRAPSHFVGSQGRAMVFDDPAPPTPTFASPCTSCWFGVSSGVDQLAWRVQTSQVISRMGLCALP